MSRGGMCLERLVSSAYTRYWALCAGIKVRIVEPVEKNRKAVGDCMEIKVEFGPGGVCCRPRGLTEGRKISTLAETHRRPFGWVTPPPAAPGINLVSSSGCF
jgi:hypothetical protein